jgi:Secretion system C-terminal sorting domain
MRPGEFRIYSTTPFPAPPRGLITSVKEPERTGSQMQSGAYPNPTSEAAEIRFSLTEESRVSVKIYDATGRELSTLVNTRLQRGEHRFIWQAGNDAPSDGVYFYRIASERGTETGKIVVVR